jgi:YVTN family beta-propeller protein
VLVDARPRMAAFTPDGAEVWVSAEIGGDVVIVDSASFKIKDRVKFEVPGLRSENVQPVGINISRDGKLAFVSLGPANRIAVVDVKTRQVLKYLLVGQRVWHAAFTPDEKYLLTTNGISNDVSVIDVAAQKVIKSIQVGESPWDLAIPAAPKP